jgi:hypothetical protein
MRHHRNDLGFLNSWFGTRRTVVQIHSPRPSPHRTRTYHKRRKRRAPGATPRSPRYDACCQTSNDIYKGRVGGLNSAAKSMKWCLNYAGAGIHFFFLPRIWRAEIFASASTIPELVKMASGQCFSAAFCSRAKSSSFIFTFTCVVRFIRLVRVSIVRWLPSFSCAPQI